MDTYDLYDCLTFKTTSSIVFLHKMSRFHHNRTHFQYMWVKWLNVITLSILLIAFSISGIHVLIDFYIFLSVIQLSYEVYLCLPRIKHWINMLCTNNFHKYHTCSRLVTRRYSIHQLSRRLHHSTWNIPNWALSLLH